jgi:hypothetical protein
MDVMQRFVRRKQWCDEQLCLAETDPNFRLLRRTHGGGRSTSLRRIKGTCATRVMGTSARLLPRDESNRGDPGGSRKRAFVPRRDVIVRSEHVEILGALAEALCTTTA